MIIHNKSKNRRSFTVGNHRFDLVHGNNTVPESKQIIKFAKIHPDLTIVENEKVKTPEPVKEKNKKPESNKEKRIRKKRAKFVMKAKDDKPVKNEKKIVKPKEK